MRGASLVKEDHPLPMAATARYERGRTRDTVEVLRIFFLRLFT